MSDEELGLGRFSDPALFVLVSLAGGEKHGYAMIEDIEETCGARPGLARSTGRSRGSRGGGWWSRWLLRRGEGLTV